MSRPVMSLEALSVGYGKRPVLSNVTLDFVEGQFNILIGANGAGKSTLLRTLAGLQSPIGGEIKLRGKNLFKLSPLEKASELAFVSSSRISPWGLTVIDMVRMGRYAKVRDEGLCVRALKDVGAEDLASRKVTELSDGELQRVQIARALAQEPKVLLLDEPTSFLDLPRRRDMVSTLRRLATIRSISMVLSLHDLDLATLFADRTLLIDQEGRLLTNIPEVLGLDGSIAQAYNQSSCWDPLSIPEGPDAGLDFSLRLEGDGRAFLWTERALRRIGIVIDNSSSFCVKIIFKDDKVCWLVDDKEKLLFHDLASLVESLKKIARKEDLQC